MLQPRQDDLLAGLLDLAGEEDLVEDGVDLVEVEDEVELAHVAEEGVEHLDEEVDRLEERQLVVVGVDARAKEEPRVPPVHDLVVPELDKVGLVLLVPRRDEPVDLLSLWSAGVRRSRKERGGGAWDGALAGIIHCLGTGGRESVRLKRGGRRESAHTSPLSLIFSSSSYGTYHLASRVLPLVGRVSVRIRISQGGLVEERPNSLPVLDQDKGQHLGRLWLAVGRRGDEARMVWELVSKH